MTALTQKLTNAELRQIIDSHEKGHAMVVPINCDYLAAKELLAVREAQSVPVAGTCDQEVYNHGVSACMVDIPKHMAEAICRSLSLATGFRIDWQYFGGRVHIKALAPPAPTVPAELLDAMAEVIRISDRDHEAWNRAKAAISACRAAKPVAPIEMTGALAMTKYGIKRSNYTQWVKGWNACRAAMLQSCDAVRDLSTPVDPQIAEYEQSDLRSSGNSEPVSQGYTLPDDTRRMDWLVAHHVEVRKPLLYGSEKMFTAQTLTDEEDDYHATSLREQIDAAMAAAPTPTKAGDDE